MQPNIALLCAATIETVLFQLMKLNPHLQSDFQPLNGKVIEIRLTQLPWSLYFICNDEILVLTQYEASADVSLNTDLQTLYQIRKGASLTELIKADKLQMDGDINILQQFSHYLEKLEFDLIEPVSKYIGDVPAYLLQTSVNQFTNKLKSISKGTARHLSELAIEEYQLSPHRIQYLHFCDQLEKLTSDADKLAKRIASLKDQYQV